MFLFVFTGVGGVLRFPWHLVRGMDRCRCEIVARLLLLFDFVPIAVVANGGHLRGFYSTGMGLGIQVLIRLGSIFWPSRAKHAKRETPPDFGGGGAHFVQSRLVDHFWVRGKRLTAVLVLRNRIDTTRQPRKHCFNLT